MAIKKQTMMVLIFVVKSEDGLIYGRMKIPIVNKNVTQHEHFQIAKVPILSRIRLVVFVNAVKIADVHFPPEL